jgi:hypothetical protein
MALIKVREIFWRRNSPYGGYSSGDVVSIYYNNSTDAIVVQKNGTTVTSGGSIPFHFYSNGQPASYYKTENGSQTEIDLVVCLGTTRKQFPRTISTFPYVLKVNLSGNPSCSVSPIVCDLTINSLPILVNESSQGAADGQITVTGTSSNGSIEYALNNDFVYGSGSSSGIFAGLTSGVYRIYARDAANCADSIGVSISYDRTYGTLFVLEYDDREGDQSKIEILERDYVGASSEIKGGGTPILIRQRGEGEQDKFVPVIGTEVDITLTSEVKFEYLDLFTSDPNKYRVVFSKDFGSGYETLITAKLLPNQYKETYIDAPYHVNFLSTDGIASLKDIPFLDAGGNQLSGTYRCIDLIAYCLRATGLQLDIRVAVNLYADDMDETDADDPLDQAYVDVQSYYTDDTLSHLDVIIRILEPFGAQLSQWGNRWNITRVEEKVDEYDYRDFDYTGVYISNGSFNPLLISQERIYEGVIWVDAPELEMNSAFGSIRLEYTLGLVENLLKNGDFKLRDAFNPWFGEYTKAIDFRGFQLVANGDDSAGLAYQIVDAEKIRAGSNAGTILPDKNNIALSFSARGNAYILSKPINIKLGFSDTLTFRIRCGVPAFNNQEFPYVKVRCIVKYGDYYLTANGDWSLAVSEITYFCKDFGKYTEFSTTSSGYPTGAAPGDDLQVTVYHAYVFHSTVDTLSDQRAIETGGTISAGSFIIGHQYTILTVGTTNFTLIGASANTIGIVFVATGAGSGSGTATSVLLGIGYRIERDDFSNADFYYYELEQNTNAESVPDIVRPNDYSAGTNPYQWILKTKRDPTNLAGTNNFFVIDKISINYQSQGYDAPTKFEASINAEENNPNILIKTVKHGSIVEIVQNNTRTVPVVSPYTSFTILGYLNNFGFIETQYTETVVQNAEQTYFGYFRDSAGVGYENWHRSYTAESLKLHDIQLSSLASQYNRTWRRMRGALTGKEYVTPLNCIQEERDEDRKYYPVSLEIDDKNRVFTSEFIELTDVVSDSGTTNPEIPAGFSLGFSLGFNS